MLAHTRWACTGRTRSFPLALVLTVTHSTLTLLLLRSDTRLNLGGAIGTFLLYSNSFFVLLHNFYTFCSMFFFLLPFCCCCCRCCAFFCVVFFFIATRDRGSSSSPAMCNCPLPLPSLLQSLSPSHRHRHRWCVWTPTCCYFTRTRTQASPFRYGENI